MRRSAKKICLAVIILQLSCFVAHAAAASLSDDEAMADLVASIKPSVVAVGTYYFNDVPKAGLHGTGFVISDGLKIVTNYHVIAGTIEKKKEAYLRIFHKSFDAKGIRARIIGTDKFHDLAILEHGGKPLPVLDIAPKERVREGYQVVVSGYPIGFVLGLNMTSHFGRISAIAPLLRPSPSARIIAGKHIRHLKNPYDILQIDATAFPGNSGSPVILISTGEVVGIINRVFVKERKEHALTNPSGISYAIPAEFITQLKDKIAQKNQ